MMLLLGLRMLVYELTMVFAALEAKARSYSAAPAGSGAVVPAAAQPLCRYYATPITPAVLASHFVP